MEPQPLQPVRPEDSSQPLVVVTGGTGFIGSHLLDRLVGRGQRVRLLARRRAQVLRTHSADIDVVWGDIRDSRAVSRALRGADVVYHLAGHAKPWARHESAFTSVNGEGTANVCDAARENGVRRVVHVSTALLAPPSEPELDVDYNRTAYQRSKRRAEDVVRRYVEEGGGAVIVRPSRIYGPGPLNYANSVTRLIDLHSRGRFRLRIADANVRGNYVYVRDVVDGLIAAAEQGANGATYVLGGANCTIRQFLAAIESDTGRPRATVCVPRTMAKVVGLTAELAARVGVEPLITRDWVDVLCYDWPLSSKSAREEIGYTPLPFREGVRRTLTWLQGNRAVPFAAQ